MQPLVVAKPPSDTQRHMVESYALSGIGLEGTVGVDGASYRLGDWSQRYARLCTNYSLYPFTPSPPRIILLLNCQHVMDPRQFSMMQQSLALVMANKLSTLLAVIIMYLVTKVCLSTQTRLGK